MLMKSHRLYCIVSSVVFAASGLGACGTPTLPASGGNLAVAASPVDPVSPDAAQVAAQVGTWVGTDAARAALLANARPFSSEDCHLHFEAGVGFRLGARPVLGADGGVATDGGQPIFLPGIVPDVTSLQEDRTTPRFFQHQLPDGRLLVAIPNNPVLWAIDCANPRAVPTRFAELEGADFSDAILTPEKKHLVFPTADGFALLSLETAKVTQTIQAPQVPPNNPYYGDTWDLTLNDFGVDGLGIGLSKPSPTCDPELAESSSWTIPYQDGRVTEDPHAWRPNDIWIMLVAGPDGVVWLASDGALWRSDDDARTFTPVAGPTDFEVDDIAVGSRPGELVVVGTKETAVFSGSDPGVQTEIALWQTADPGRTWRRVDGDVDVPNATDEESDSDEDSEDSDDGAPKAGASRRMSLARLAKAQPILRLWNAPKASGGRVRVEISQTEYDRSFDGEEPLKTFVFERQDDGKTWLHVQQDSKPMGGREKLQWKTSKGHEVVLELRAAGLTREVAGQPAEVVFVPIGATRRLWVRERPLSPDVPPAAIDWAQFDNAQAALARGVAHAARNDWRKAIAAYAEALAIDPDEGRSHFETARAHARAGRKAEAVAALEALRVRGGFQALSLLYEAARHADFKGLAKFVPFQRVTAVERITGGYDTQPFGEGMLWPTIGSDRAERMCIGLPIDEAGSDPNPARLAFTRFDCETGAEVGALAGTMEDVVRLLESRPFVSWRPIGQDDPARNVLIAWAKEQAAKRWPEAEIDWDSDDIDMAVSPSGRLVSAKIGFDEPGTENWVERLLFGPYPGGGR
jgi:hypothetical protein